ncbi:MAG TPA: RNA polymerase sigma factor [Gemmataceae bacterium]|jgi:RNA polymerase sigma factor (sigma-70 family)
MSAGQLDGVIRYLRKVARAPEASQAGDAELLERFITSRDERAFELLVRRHGPMVLGVCKRVLRNYTDAEDAFQATFLVLVRKATSIRPRTQVGSWLHGVAYKTALKARALNLKRRVKERHAAATQVRQVKEDTWEAVLEILDSELNALPEKYRIPVILCDLEGLSYQEAAARLKCPQGTLSGRLTRARSLLAHRVALRSTPVGTATLFAYLAANATASLTPSLISGTIRAGVALAVGKALTQTAISAKVASLAEGVLKMVLLSKLKMATGGLVIFVAIVTAGWMSADRLSARVLEPGGDDKSRIEDKLRGPARSNSMTNRPTQTRQAEFVFLNVEKERKAVSLVVAGTSAPVLCLPVKEDLRVLVGGRQIEIDGLRPGNRIVIHLDSTNRVIQEIRVLERPGKVAVIKGSNDQADLDAPEEAEVLRALSPVPRSVPGVVEVFRDNIQLVTERLSREVEQPRLYPLVGEAELIHGHWKCTVFYSETVKYVYPFPARTTRARVEVVYIDKDYLVPTR